MSAYDETYVSGAQTRLGGMVDLAVNGLGCDLADFYGRFLESPLAIRFGNGDPAIVAGRSGAELALELLAAERGFSHPADTARAGTASPEYWTGWALAFYQWASGFAFEAIEERVPVGRVWALYRPYHEMEIRQFCDEMDRLAHVAHPQTNLQVRRLAAGLSQGQLAKAAGVPVRTLQQYEQRQKDVNRARAEYVAALARVLCCRPDDLLEHLAGPAIDYAVVPF